MLNNLSKILFFSLLFMPLVNAQLVPIEEHELSQTIGQAFINVDRLQTARNSSNDLQQK